MADLILIHWQSLLFFMCQISAVWFHTACKTGENKSQSLTKRKGMLLEMRHSLVRNLWFAANRLAKSSKTWKTLIWQSSYVDLQLLTKSIFMQWVKIVCHQETVACDCRFCEFIYDTFTFSTGAAQSHALVSWAHVALTFVSLSEVNRNGSTLPGLSYSSEIMSLIYCLQIATDATRWGQHFVCTDIEWTVRPPQEGSGCSLWNQSSPWCKVQVRPRQESDPNLRVCVAITRHSTYLV